MRRNHMSIPKFRRLHRWRLGIETLFHPKLYDEGNYLPMPGLKWNRVRKWVYQSLVVLNIFSRVYCVCLLGQLVISPTRKLVETSPVSSFTTWIDRLRMECLIRHLLHFDHFEESHYLQGKAFIDAGTYPLMNPPVGWFNMKMPF